MREVLGWANDKAQGGAAGTSAVRLSPPTSSLFILTTLVLTTHHSSARGKFHHLLYPYVNCLHALSPTLIHRNLNQGGAWLQDRLAVETVIMRWDPDATSPALQRRDSTEGDDDDSVSISVGVGRNASDRATVRSLSTAVDL